MKKFIGREREIAQLKRLYDGSDFQSALVYGRRRIGKSELIKQSVKGSRLTVLYYECKQTTEKNNIDGLSEIMAEKLNFPKPDFPSFEKALEYLFIYSQKKKIVLVLDEYPYLHKIIDGIDSILQSLIDKYKDTAKLKLIICGSYLDVMKSLLDNQNPLYGRISLSLDIKPMDYYDSAKFYPSFSNADKVKLYSVFGGIPYYNELINSKLSVKENIIHLITAVNSRLESEINFYLKNEMAKVNNANIVFETIARGLCKFNDIFNASGIDKSATFADVLERLGNIELIDKEAPINDERNKKKSIYYIKDNLSLFYYTYVYRYLSQRGIMNEDAFYEKYIEKDFEERYVPKMFERIFKQYLIRQNRQGNITPPLEKVGKYYYDDVVNKKNGEFDVVSLDENGYIFYEAKYKNKPINQSMIDEEIKQVQATGLSCYRYGFVSKSGFEDIANDDLLLYTLDDLYA